MCHPDGQGFKMVKGTSQGVYLVSSDQRARKSAVDKRSANREETQVSDHLSNNDHK